MKELNKIKKKIDLNKTQHVAILGSLYIKALKVFEREVDKKALDRIINAAESATELTQVPNDEFLHRWTRVDFSTVIDAKNEFQREILERYLNENYSIHCDFVNDVVTIAEGPAIIVNEDGDVLDQDSGKWFLSKRDYENEQDRNEQIEKYMSKNGYFPSVVRMDHYGNVSYAITSETK